MSDRDAGTSRAPRKILLAIESGGPGGAEHVVLALARALRERGYEPHVATQRRGWLTERLERDGIPLWHVPQERGLDPGWVPRMARRLRRERIDVVHSHEFAMNVYGGAAALLARIPSVATVHGHQWATGRRRRVLAYRGLMRLGMRVVAVSQELAGFLARGFGVPTGALEVVYNGIAAAEAAGFPGEEGAKRAARQTLGLPDSAPLVVAVGNLYPVKDHATLLRAAAPLPAHVAIAGRGDEEPRLRALAAELGTSDRVHLLGLRDDVEQLLAAADVFALPSRSEGLPLALLEAMAAGLPIAATRVGGVPEAVDDGETGLLVPARDPEALRRALDSLLGDPGLRAKLGRAARSRVRADFSITRMTERYARLYESPRRRRPARPGRSERSGRPPAPP